MNEWISQSVDRSINVCVYVCPCGSMNACGPLGWMTACMRCCVCCSRPSFRPQPSTGSHPRPPPPESTTNTSIQASPRAPTRSKAAALGPAAAPFRCRQQQQQQGASIRQPPPPQLTGWVAWGKGGERVGSIDRGRGQPTHTVVPETSVPTRVGVKSVVNRGSVRPRAIGRGPVMGRTHAQEPLVVIERLAKPSRSPPRLRNNTPQRRSLPRRLCCDSLCTSCFRVWRESELSVPASDA